MEKAEETLREALTLDEKNIEIHSQLADIYINQNNTANALSTLTSLSQIYYENEEVDAGIETARKIKIASLAASQGNRVLCKQEECGGQPENEQLAQPQPPHRDRTATT